MFIEATALGPAFSSQVWSTIWVETVWPRTRLALGKSRWTIEGKNPSMFEKWWGASVGVGLSCVEVREANSSAITRPRMVTRRAASLSRGGIVITGVFRGRKLEVISKPATMLPQANRLIGLMTAGLFSLMGERVLKRGKPIETKNTTRRL